MRVHISLKVSSLEESMAFYSVIFGQPASKTRDGYANFRLDQPPVHLALVESDKPTGSGVSHLGIELPSAEALDDWRERLEQSPVGFDVEDEARCCYAKADKLWLSDPDGYRWEVWVRTGDFDGIGATHITSEANKPANKIESRCCA